MRAMSKFVEAPKKAEILDSTVIAVEAEGKRLALMNLNGEIYAIDDECPPAVALSKGVVR